MKSIHFKFLITLTMLCTGVTVHGSWLTNDSANRKGFALISRQGSVPLVYDKQDFPVVEIATGDLAEDIQAVTGQTPDISTSLPDTILNAAVLIGTLGKSDLINAVASNGKVPELKTLRGQWEGYLIKVVEYPLPGIKRALVIAGSDRRGTAFGVYQLSKAIGVSPWHWWAEVPVKKRDTLLLRADLAVLKKPHVLPGDVPQ